MTCNLGHPMCLRHPVIVLDQTSIPLTFESFCVSQPLWLPPTATPASIETQPLRLPPTATPASLKSRENKGLTGFVCKLCRIVFGSAQALGGHRSQSSRNLLLSLSLCFALLLFLSVSFFQSFLFSLSLSLSFFPFLSLSLPLVPHHLWQRAGARRPPIAIY